MSPTAPGSPPERPPALGYDVVRLAATACVAAQHALSVTGVAAPDLPRGLDLGQVGVTTFCALSGALALRGGGDPLGWLARRLARIYPPYWMALAAIFAANWAVGYKPVTAGLVAAEFLGVAYFTHPGSLVGVHTWFLALILACYGVGALIRRDRRLLPACAAAAVALLPLDPGLIRHILSFLAGATLAAMAGPGRAAAWAAAACLVASAAWPGPAYPAVGAAAALVGGLIPGRSPRALAGAGRASYEFFLVHGPIYLALARFAGLGLAGVATFGTAAAVAAALALQAADRAARATLARLRPAPARRREAPGAGRPPVVA